MAFDNNKNIEPNHNCASIMAATRLHEEFIEVSAKITAASLSNQPETVMQLSQQLHDMLVNKMSKISPECPHEARYVADIALKAASTIIFCLQECRSANHGEVIASERLANNLRSLDCVN